MKELLKKMLYSLKVEKNVNDVVYEAPAHGRIQWWTCSSKSPDPGGSSNDAATSTDANNAAERHLLGYTKAVA